MTSLIANGIQLEFEERGSTNDPAIVLVRGLGTQLIDWPETFLSGLVSAGFRVIVFDNRDVGLSQKFLGLPTLAMSPTRQKQHRTRSMIWQMTLSG